MYEAQPHPSKLLTGKHVQAIEDDENGVTVTTKDGGVYKGDIVIGADGVWSTVRQSMWKAMERDGQTKDLSHDKQGKHRTTI
jgi:2-polyprenyl-6-methoxyphenol hydroxylase-like FAD-dependent oxidoreductase